MQAHYNLLSQELHLKSRPKIFTQIRAQMGMMIKQDVLMISLHTTTLKITPIYSFLTYMTVGVDWGGEKMIF